MTQQFNPTSFTDPTQIQANARSALSAHTSVNYVIWPTGGLPLTPVLDGIAASPDSGAQLLVDDASPENVQLLSQGKLPVVVEGPGAILGARSHRRRQPAGGGWPGASGDRATDPDQLLDQERGASAHLPGYHEGAAAGQQLGVALRATAWHVPALESVILGVAS